MLVSVVSLKGGAGKTTTAIHLAVVAAKAGADVVLIDADPEQSALSWASLTDLPLEVVPAERDGLARQARDIAATKTVVIDTPPNDREILMRASMVSDVVVVPVKPTGLDVHRLRPTLELLREVEASRGTLDVAILFTHWDGRRILSREAEEALAAFPLLESRIRNLTRYEQAFGAEPVYLEEYERTWKELRNG